MAQLRISKSPLHIQVQQHLLSLIEDGTYSPGDQFPSEVTLADQLGISRPTLREALQRLEQEGVIVRRHGVGTFVATRTPILESGLEVLESLASQAGRVGLETEVMDLDVIERPASPEEMSMLGLGPAEGPIDVLSIDRVIAVAGEPVAYLRDVVPQTCLRREDLEHFSGSVLDVFLQRDPALPIVSRTEIMAEAARTHVAARLGISRGQALLKLVGQLYGQDERVLDYSISYFVPGHFRFHVMRRVARIVP
ncbi:MAG TPA: GntR family transcriptional regulator [Chloroflexi bacterium]|nr:GntR family transcriptional regulator [Chloroflexota bacterium]